MARRARSDELEGTDHLYLGGDNTDAIVDAVGEPGPALVEGNDTGERVEALREADTRRLFFHQIEMRPRAGDYDQGRADLLQAT